MGSNDARSGWFDEDVAPKGRIARVRTPKPSSQENTFIEEGKEIRVGNTVVRVRGRQAVREEEPRLAPIRSQPAPSARRQSRNDLMSSYAERQRQQLKQRMVDTLWMAWPFAIGAIGFMMLLTGLAGMNPLLVVVGLFLGFMAWKGKTIADWFDAKEAERKAARAEAERKAVEQEAERRVRQAAEQKVEQQAAERSEARLQEIKPKPVGEQP